MIMSRFRRRVAGTTAAASKQQQVAADGTATGSTKRRHAIFYDVESGQIEFS